MTAQNGEGVYGDGAGVVTPLAHKLSQNGPLVKDSTGKPRSGVFYAGNASLVTGKANMSYDVAAFEAAICRGRTKGTSYPTNDAVVNVTTTAAPGSNSRIDIIYIQQKEVSEGDDATEAVIDVVQGTAASSPSAPTLPDGAIELARAVVAAGITATTSATITQTAPFTAPLGSAIPFRNSTERDAAGAFVTGQRAWLLDTGIEYRYTGSGWLPAVSEMVIASGTFTSASSVILDNLGSTVFRDIIIELDVSAASASHTLAAQLRSAGSTNSAAVYDRQLLFGADSTTTSFKATNATEWGIGATASRNIRRVTISLSRLADAVATLGRIEYEEFDATTGAAEITTGIRHKTASAFDGIIITPSSGTITGTYTVRGKVR